MSWVKPTPCLSIWPTPLWYRVIVGWFLTYLFGDQRPNETVREVEECVSLYLDSPEGFMARDKRPQLDAVSSGACLRCLDQTMHLAEGILPLTHATAGARWLCLWWYGASRGEQQAQRDSPTSPVVISGVTSLLFAATLCLYRFPWFESDEPRVPDPGPGPHGGYSPYCMAHFFVPLQAVFLLTADSPPWEPIRWCLVFWDRL